LRRVDALCFNSGGRDSLIAMWVLVLGGFDDGELM
jgi:hypothetical protein